MVYGGHLNKKIPVAIMQPGKRRKYNAFYSSFGEGGILVSMSGRKALCKKVPLKDENMAPLAVEMEMSFSFSMNRSGISILLLEFIFMISSKLTIL